MTTQARFARCR